MPSSVASRAVIAAMAGLGVGGGAVWGGGPGGRRGVGGAGGGGGGGLAVRGGAGGVLEVAAAAGGDEPVRAGAGQVVLGQVAGVGQGQPDRAGGVLACGFVRRGAGLVRGDQRGCLL